MDNKYCVIGGQYQYYYYGSTPTLIGAKRLAGKHQEYWDNWQGWHIPDIYRWDDTEPCDNFYGSGRRPKFGAVPVCFGVYLRNNTIEWRKPF